MKYFVPLLLLLATIPFAQQSRADALIINKSMLASNIIEFYIDDEGVTVELDRARFSAAVQKSAAR